MMKKWLCVVICCCLMLTMVAACGDTPATAPQPTPEAQETPAPEPPQQAIYVLDFSDGKADFLALDTGSPDTDIDSGMAIVSLDGANALRLTAPNGRAIRLGINVDGLLGDKVSDVRMIAFEVYAEYPDGNFSAVSGKISAMSGDMNPFADTIWQIYLASRNPNPVRLEFMMDDGFSSTEPNLIEFSCTTNGPADKGETAANIYIKSITFYDENNTAMQINTDAGFTAPDGFGAIVILGGWMLPNPPPIGNPGAWQYWLTPGTDDDDRDYMPWEVLAASFGITFVMDEPDSFEFVFFGAFQPGDGWNWTQVNIANYWEDGTLTVMWDDIGFEAFKINEEDYAVKIAIGNWNDAPITSVYLLYDEDAVP